jgi:hypothetical protein
VWREYRTPEGDWDKGVEMRFHPDKPDVRTNADRKVDYGLAGSFGKVDFYQA